MNKAGVSFIRGDNDVVMKNNFVKEIKGKDVYWEAHPPFLVSRLLGVAPMDSMFLLTKGLAGFTVAFLMFNIYLGVHLSITMERANNMFEMSGFSLILERAQLAIIICSVVVSGLKAIFNVKTLYGVMRQLAYLDRKLYEIGINVPYSRLYGYLLTSARLALIMSLFLPDLFVFKSWRNMDFLVVQYILIMPLLVGNIVQVQFMVLLELVQRRIRILTDSLKDIGQGSNNVVKPNHLHILVSVHSSLLTICEIVNNLYSPQILLILSSIFIVTTANLYHVIEKMIVFISLKKWNDLNFLAMTTYRIFVRSLEVWTMVTTCVNTQELVRIIPPSLNLNTTLTLVPRVSPS